MHVSKLIVYTVLIMVLLKLLQIRLHFSNQCLDGLCINNKD